MSNVRIKRVKSRPIDSRERLPTFRDSCDGFVFIKWGDNWHWAWADDLCVWANHQPIGFYWAPARRLS